MRTDRSKDKEDRARIFIVDDHPIVRHGLRELINQQHDFIVCGEAENASAALEMIPELDPDLVIVDISLEGMSGLELIKTLKIRCIGLPILVVSMHDENLYAERSLRAGARGYIMKEEATEKVIQAIRKVCSGEIYLSEHQSNKLLQRYVEGRPATIHSDMDQLSDRELEVFHLIGQGYKTKEIADALFLSVKTIETYREHIKEKLGLRDSTALLQRATLWVKGNG